MRMIHEMRGQEEGADALKRRERKGEIDAKRKEKNKMRRRKAEERPAAERVGGAHGGHATGRSHG